MKDFPIILRFAGVTFLWVAVVGGIAGQFGWVATLEGTELPLMDLTVMAFGVVFGSVLYGMGYLLGKNIKRHHLPPVILDPGNLSFVYDALKKYRNTMLGMVIFMSLFGGGCLLTALLMPDPGDSLLPLLVVGALGIVCLWVALRCYKAYYKIKNVSKSEVYTVIMQHPETITELKAVYIKSASAPGTMGQRINVQVWRKKTKLSEFMISEKNLELLRQHVVSKNPEVKFETENRDV